MIDDTLRTIAAIVGSGGVVVAALAYRRSKQYAQTSFEDDIAREYREIAAQLPPAAFKKDGAVELDDSAERAMFRYFDLSNSQLWRIKQKRVSRKTRKIWEAGIEELIAKDTFRAAWQELDLPDDFFTKLGPLMRGDDR